MIGVCHKGRRRCPDLLAMREEALREWTEAETLREVRACWGRLGGRTTLHRYGRGHFCGLARRRWGGTAPADLDRARGA